MNKLTLTAAFALAALTVFGQTTVADVVGVYIYEGSLAAGYGSAGSTLELKPDGTFKYTHQVNNMQDVNSYATQGTWRLQGESIVMNSKPDSTASGPSQIVFKDETWELKGRKLTDYTPLNGEKKCVYVRQMGTRAATNQQGVFK